MSLFHSIRAPFLVTQLLGSSSPNRPDDPASRDEREPVLDAENRPAGADADAHEPGVCTTPELPIGRCGR